MKQKPETHSSRSTSTRLLSILWDFGRLVRYSRRMADSGRKTPKGSNQMQKSSDETALVKLESALRWSREEERHEINWIGHRLGWMLICQSFLITASIVAQSNNYEWWYGFAVSSILGVIGVWLSLRGILAIRAAQAVIDNGWLARVRDLFKSAGKELDWYRINRELYKHETPLEKDCLHQEAVKLHLNIGWMFIVAWAAIFILGFITSFTHAFPDWRIKISPMGLIITGLAILGTTVLGFFLKFRKCFRQLKIAAGNIKGTLDNPTIQSESGVDGVEKES